MAFKKLISIQMDLMYITFLQCLHPRCLSATAFVMKNRIFFLLLLLRILCFALQFFCHDGHSDVWVEACFCTNSRMGIICILMFFCSCVFLLLLPAFVKFGSLVLARDDVIVGACCV